MCQPKPGPRCAAHTRRELAAAQAAYVVAVETGASGKALAAAAKAVHDAQLQFDSTPTGQRELEEAMTTSPSAYERAALATRFAAAVALREEQTRALTAQRTAEARAAADGRAVAAPVTGPGGATRLEDGRLVLSDADAARLAFVEGSDAEVVARLGDYIGAEYDDYACADPYDCGTDGTYICRDKRYENLRVSTEFNDPYRVAAVLLSTQAEHVPHVVADKVRDLGLVGADQWDVHAYSGYYGEHYTVKPESPAFTAQRIEQLRQWFYGAPNARDDGGVLAYVRSKGTVTAGLTPVEAIRAQLRAENPGQRHEVVEKATRARVLALTPDRVSPHEDRMRQVRPSAPLIPKGATAGTAEVVGVVTPTGNGFALIDGHRRFKSVKRSPNQWRNYISLT